MSGQQQRAAELIETGPQVAFVRLALPPRESGSEITPNGFDRNCPETAETVIEERFADSVGQYATTVRAGAARVQAAESRTAMAAAGRVEYLRVLLLTSATAWWQ